MGPESTAVRAPGHGPACRLVVRKEDGLTATLQFVTAGLESWQQVFAMGGASCLKELAHRLGAAGLRPETLLRSRRLVFLTAPDCILGLLKPGDPFKHGPFTRNGSLLRWVSDWSWARGPTDLQTVLNLQRRMHVLLHSIPALSLCTVDGEQMERSSLLALLADHRRAVKACATQDQPAVGRGV